MMVETQVEDAVRLVNLTKAFPVGRGTAVPRAGEDEERMGAVERVNLSIHKGEILAVLGPSGCGKTTLLRLIAGFERPTAGAVYLDGKLVAAAAGAGHFAGERRTAGEGGGDRMTPPERRGVGMVFQEHALFPHLTVMENVRFGLLKKDARTAETTSSFLLRLVGLEGMAVRYPHELSGGERQRVALARAMAPQPVLILFDEPFSNLDADRRIRMREDVRAILKTTGSTALFVTHDQEEAMYMGDRIAVMNQGRLEQVGTPETVFHQPATRFVAEFMGHTDFIEGEVTPDGMVLTEVGLVRQQIDAPPGTRVALALRFDDIQFTPQAGEKSMVLARHFKGAYNLYRLRLPSGRLVHAMQPHNLVIRPGTPVRITIEPGHPLAWFVADGSE